ncbi:hypothetical protein K432DRAFT_386567 [Lepidopterella palustris CBS 459.81]|uniref:Tse2 ADP-ribosyltransferase toxin domain-containing protein n=1 Tax=Lepidopterella palustris CBS 459.81 TaxID=1314670 RepID=A0A8E2DZY1_9PEZI|nr:hypothetical protein K432DRAFT_386567 [Lepidopterella palustris CBS 459.81]
MFCRISRPISLSAANSWLPPIVRRRLSTLGPTYATFPASLLRLNAGATFKQLHDERKALSEHYSADDMAKVLKELDKDSVDWTRLPVSDGATLMPNTFDMQQIIRGAVDRYYEDQDNGVIAERPFLFTILKVLVRITLAAFSLQPSRPSSPNVLNRILDDFYSKHAETRTAEDWLDEHDYQDAFADEEETLWMAK